MKKIVFLLGVSLLAISCSSDDDNNNDVDNEPLHGEVQNVNFVAKGGYAFYNSDKTEISLDITNVVAGCESDPLAYTLYVSANVPAEVGVYNNINVAFAKKGTPILNAFGSTVIVDSITDTTITVRIDSDPEDLNGIENEIEGSVTIPICE